VDGVVWENYLSINNSLAVAIESMLGTKQMGALLTSICLKDGITGYIEYRHGTTPIWRSTDNSNTHLYTYLVFRKSASSRNVVLIPIKDGNL
jgi:hypothetical protein